MVAVRVADEIDDGDDQSQSPPGSTRERLDVLIEQLKELTRAVNELTREARLRTHATRLANDPAFQAEIERAGKVLETEDFGDDLITPEEYERKYLKG